MSDSLSVIEGKWTLLVGADDSIHGFAWPNGNRHLVTNPHMDTREVEVVPAEQLRGAVGSLRVIIAALEGFRDELGGSTRDRVGVALTEAREALAALGGQ
jgi:hypothetical protein